ncbi:hypothetical protein BEP19_15130 [Ammoniphilus oxalaticus]|uniref:Uncharacterized protein n=1 Tax=Ammoniphilus oxalaticus TaxID=66863 RepID=A0A419SDP8_9BACL|nr:hypothetical protein [Ammoniphilus oxalaticus]RKD21013.1 hypothetical protein BEP19_15130 [Ammoniphilus oxalaticus]
MWVVENYRPFEPTYGRGKHFKTGTKFVWEVADVVHGGRILFRFTTVDGRNNCIVTMRELDYFIEVSDEALQKLLEQYRQSQQQRNKNDPRSDEPPKSQ